MAKRSPPPPKKHEGTPIPPTEFRERAEECLQAYRALPDIGLFNWPKYMMLGQATELILKAYLLTPTATHQEPVALHVLEKEIRHDLDRLLTEAVGRGLPHDTNITKNIAFLSRAHNHYQPRYPLVEIETKGSMPGGPWAVVVQELEPSVTKLFEQIRRAMPY
jgi:hypothetical protein